MSPFTAPSQPLNEESLEAPFDFSFVNTTARIAIYDDLRSAPRVVEIPPAETGLFIENLASTIYNQARTSGGSIPYTVIREVSENFIHARFQEIIVSIMDNGNTIRFADQGPGIASKDKAQLPGFSSAVEPMKHYIRGVGSGLPIVKDYLDVSHGSITIEDNLNCGSVITISLEKELSPVVAAPAGAPSSLAAAPQPPSPAIPSAGGKVAYQTPPMEQPAEAMPVNPAAPYPAAAAPANQPVPYYGAAYPQQNIYGQPAAYPAPAAYPYSAAPTHQRALGHTVIPHLSENARTVLRLLNNEGGPLRITDITEWTGIAPSSTYKILSQLEDQGLIARDLVNTKLRTLTDIGYQVAQALHD